MSEKLKGCEGCDADEVSILTYPDKDFDVAIILGQLTKEERVHPFDSPRIRKLKLALINAGIDHTKCLWMYANPCKYPKDPTPAMLRRCAEHTHNILKYHRVKYVLIVGKDAFITLVRGKTFGRSKGSVVRLDGDILAIPVDDYTDVLLDRDKQYDFDNAIAYFKRLITSDFVKVEPNYALIDTTGKLAKLKYLIQQTPYVVYDLETTGLDPKTDRVKMVGFAGRYGKGVWSAIVPIDEDTLFGASISKVAPLFCTGTPMIAHNAKFDDRWMYSRGINIHSDHDTMVMSYLENELQSHSLKSLLKAKFGFPPYELDIKHDSSSFDDVAYYCAIDCIGTLMLFEDYIGGYKITDTPHSFIHVYNDILMPIQHVSENIERRGVYIDKEKLEAVRSKTEEDLAVRQDQLLKLLPKKFPKETIEVNLNSPAQLKKILYDKEVGFRYKPIYLDEAFDDEDDKDPTTNKAALKRLARKGSKFCEELLEYRRLSKMMSGFIIPWLEKVKDADRIYPKLNVSRTTTGRTSSEDPNLQQVSRDPAIRNIIAAPPGYKFIEADYSQIELRVASVVGGIESMKRIYREGGDIHKNTGRAMAILAGVDWDSLDKKEQKSWRQRAKAVNFGYVYGMSAKGFKDYADVSYDLILTEAEAELYRDTYFRLYPELEDWHKRARAEAQKLGYVRTRTGRVRHLPNLYSLDGKRKSSAGRCAINTPVQGLASELTLLSMIRLEGFFSKYGVGDTVRLVGQCHDAIFVECREDLVDEVCRLIYNTMTIPTEKEWEILGGKFDVPLDVEIKIGQCWGDPSGKIYERS